MQRNKMKTTQWKIRKVAMTGGTGPIGMALIQRLLAEDIDILLLQRPGSLRTKWLPQNRHIQIAFYGLESLQDVFSNPSEGNNDFDVFFHLGWANTYKTDRERLDRQFANVEYSCDAVRLAERLGCHTFIGCGSQAECGRKQEALRADTLCQPENAYGIAKLATCYATRMLCNQLGIRHIWTRVLSAYGLYDNMHSVIISPILKKLAGERELQFTKGEQVWDFTYTYDIADALYLLALHGQADAIYPLGSGKAHLLREYLQILVEKLQMQGLANFGAIPYADKQIMYLAADNNAIYQDTGWTPSTGFEDGINKVIRFYENFVQTTLGKQMLEAIQHDGEGGKR